MAVLGRQTQKGVDETMPNPKSAFGAWNNEVEAIVAESSRPGTSRASRPSPASATTSRSGRMLAVDQAVLKKHSPDVKFVLELFPKLGVTDFTSHIAAIQQASPIC